MEMDQATAKNSEKRTGKILAKCLRCVLIVVICFALFNLFWFVWRAVKYGSYADGMEKAFFYETLVPRFTCTDEEGYTYYVKYPDYLTFTGNLAISEQREVDGIIVWPLFGGGYEYGFLLDYDGEQYQIYVDENGNAIHEEDATIIEACRPFVDRFVEKARLMWGLE